MYLRALSEGHLPENKSDFLDLLHQFMRKRNTPIGRIPSLGFKKRKSTNVSNVEKVNLNFLLISSYVIFMKRLDIVVSTVLV